jgi:heme/copper-type cytochrome/quinol oxidase subunit 4
MRGEVQHMDNKLFSMILVFLPVLLIQLGLQIYCFIDLYKRTSVRFNNKVIWVLVILFGNILGSILYLIFREEKNNDAGNTDN